MKEKPGRREERRLISESLSFMDTEGDLETREQSGTNCFQNWKEVKV